MTILGTVEKLLNRHTQEQEEAVRILQHMLSLAEQGKIAAVAVAYVRENRVSTSHAWSSSTCVAAQIGAVSVMHGQMVIAASNLGAPNPDANPEST